LISQPFSDWWCCLNPRERNTLIVLIGSWFTNPTYIGRATFDALVLVTGESSSILMLEYFMLHYSLEYQLIPCGEDCFIDAVVFIGDLWPALYAFSLTDDFICAEPCIILTFSQ
jgi:hypothetical protein